MKALPPMLVTPSGISIEVKLDAYWNALDPMDDNCDSDSNIIDAKLLHCLNASLPILGTIDPIITELIFAFVIIEL